MNFKYFNVLHAALHLMMYAMYLKYVGLNELNLALWFTLGPWTFEWCVLIKPEPTIL